MLDIQNKIEEAKKIDKIMSVSWEVKGGYFDSENVMIVICGLNGYEWSLIIHPKDGEVNKSMKSDEKVILNTVLSRFGLLDSCVDDVAEVINHLRKKYPYKGTFFVNEEQCCNSFFTEPIHRF